MEMKEMVHRMNNVMKEVMEALKAGARL